MPAPIYEKWSILPADIGQLSDAHDTTPFMFMTPDRLRPLRNYVKSNPLAPIGRLQSLGEHLSELDSRRAQYNASRAKVNKGMKKLRDSDKKQKTPTPVARHESALRLLEAQQRYKEFHTIWDEPAGDALLSESPLTSVRVGNSASSKLNYILNDVRDVRSIRATLRLIGVTAGSLVRRVLEVPHLLQIAVDAAIRCRGPEPDGDQIQADKPEAGEGGRTGRSDVRVVGHVSCVPDGAQAWRAWPVSAVIPTILAFDAEVHDLT